MALTVGSLACKQADSMLVVPLTPPTPAVTADRLVFTVTKSGQSPIERTHAGGFEAATRDYALPGIPAAYAGTVSVHVDAFQGTCQVAATQSVDVAVSAGKTARTAPLAATALPCGGPPPPDGGPPPTDAGSDEGTPAPADAGPDTTVEEAAPSPPDAGPGPDTGTWNLYSPNFAKDDLPTSPRLAAVDGTRAFLAWRKSGNGLSAADLPSLSMLANPKPDATNPPAGLALIHDAGLKPYVAWAETSKVTVKRYEGAAAVPWVQLGDPFGAPGITTAADCPALVFDPNGDLVVAWPQGAPSSIYLRHWNGTSWDTTYGGPLPARMGDTGDAGCPLLASRGSTTLAAAWVHGSGQTRQIYVQRYSAAGWQAWGGPLPTGAAATSVKLGGLVLDGSGQPTVAWQESSPGKSAIFVRRWDVGAGQWVMAGDAIAEISVAGAEGPPALAIDAQQAAVAPILAWFEYANSRLSVRVWQLVGGAWKPLGAPLRGNSGNPAEIALSYGGGVPWVVFTDVSTVSNGFFPWYLR